MPTADVDISVLKTEIASLHRSIDTLSGKMDQVMAIQVQIVKLQEQHSTTRQGVDRAFIEIRNIEASVKDVAEDLQDVGGRLNTFVSRVGGGMLIAGILLAAINWFFVRQMDVIDRTAERQITTEQRLAGAEKTLNEHIRLVQPLIKEQ